GVGTVTSVGTGLGLLGGPIISAGTLTIDPTVVPQLAAANTFTGNQTITGNLSETGSISASSGAAATILGTNTSSGIGVEGYSDTGTAGLFQVVFSGSSILKGMWG